MKSVASEECQKRIKELKNGFIFMNKNKTNNAKYKRFQYQVLNSTNFP